MKEYYKIKIGNCERELPLIKGEKCSYYSFNMLGDSELNIESAKMIAELIKDCDVIVTVESKAIALTEQTARVLKQPRYVVIRKSQKSYMRNPISVEGSTIISGTGHYYLDGADIEYLKDKKIAVVDDVISTGGTMDAICRLLTKCNLNIFNIACVLCEGKITTEFKGIPVKTVGFIPLMENKL